MGRAGGASGDGLRGPHPIMINKGVERTFKGKFLGNPGELSGNFLRKSLHIEWKIGRKSRGILEEFQRNSKGIPGES